jgi:DNA-binding response OmpR family regulator
MHILYVEDDPNDAALVARYAKATNHDIVVVATLAEARTAFKSYHDLIMVDVVLGYSREGYVFAKEVRQQGYTRPLIAITALSTPQAIEECWNAGFDEVLTKPFMVDDLGIVINKYAP